jgi:hypothetical protein
VKEDEGSGHEVGGEITPVITLYSRGSRDVGTLSSTTSPSTPVPGTPSMSCTVEDVLQLLRHLFVISTFRDDAQNTADGEKYICAYSGEKSTLWITFKILMTRLIACFCCISICCW